MLSRGPRHTRRQPAEPGPLATKTGPVPVGSVVNDRGRALPQGLAVLSHATLSHAPSHSRFYRHSTSLRWRFAGVRLGERATTSGPLRVYLGGDRLAPHGHLCWCWPPDAAPGLHVLRLRHGHFGRARHVALWNHHRLLDPRRCTRSHGGGCQRQGCTALLSMLVAYVADRTRAFHACLLHILLQGWSASRFRTASIRAGSTGTSCCSSAGAPVACRKHGLRAPQAHKGSIAHPESASTPSAPFPCNARSVFCRSVPDREGRAFAKRDQALNFSGRWEIEDMQGVEFENTGYNVGRCTYHFTRKWKILAGVPYATGA